MLRATVAVVICVKTGIGRIFLINLTNAPTNAFLNPAYSLKWLGICDTLAEYSNVARSLPISISSVHLSRVTGCKCLQFIKNEVCSLIKRTQIHLPVECRKKGVVNEFQ